MSSALAVTTGLPFMADSTWFYREGGSLNQDEHPRRAAQTPLSPTIPLIGIDLPPITNHCCGNQASPPKPWHSKLMNLEFGSYRRGPESYLVEKVSGQPHYLGTMYVGRYLVGLTIVPGMCHELSRPLVVLDGSLTREGKPLISISPRVSVCGIRSSQSHFVRNRKANAAQQLSVLDLVPLSSHHSQDDTRSRKYEWDW